MTSRKIINSKLKEAVDSVLPITLIVAVLCFFFVPVGSGLMLAFLVGAVMLILGMGLFTLGAEPVSYTHLPHGGAAGQHDLVIDDHNVAGLEAEIHAAGGVGQNHRPAAQQLEQPDGRGQLGDCLLYTSRCV